MTETCARRGAGFSRFLQLVPGEGESQTTGKLCVLHFFYKGQLSIKSLCNRRTKRKWGAMRNLESDDRIELFYEDSPEAFDEVGPYGYRSTFTERTEAMHNM